MVGASLRSLELEYGHISSVTHTPNHPGERFTHIFMAAALLLVSDTIIRLSNQ